MKEKHLDLEQLQAIHAGDLEDRVALEHLASCSDCQRAFDDTSWTLLLRRLPDLLTRSPHPDSEELTAYYDQALSAPRSAEIRRHLHSCDACLVRWTRRRERQRSLNYDSTPPGLLRRVRLRFRPHPARRLGSLMLRRLGEELTLVFDPDQALGSMRYSLSSVALSEIPKIHPSSARSRKRRLHDGEVPKKNRPAPLEKHEDTLADFASCLECEPTQLPHSRLPGAAEIDAESWRLILHVAEADGATRLTVRIVERASGSPQSDVRIRLSIDDEPEAEASTDERGEAELPVAPGKGKLEIVVEPCLVLDWNAPDSV